MKRSTIITLLCISTLLIVASANAQPCRMQSAVGTQSQAGWNCPPWLNLTPEQQAGISTLQNTFMQEVALLKNSAYKNQLKMSSLLLEPTPDEVKLTKLQKNISDITAQINQKQLAYHLKARKLLSPEQQTQLPPGCDLGFGNRGCGMGGDKGPGCGKGRGFSKGKGGRCW
ncbi:MAG: Spy/CpxP family protein refolding chaperone [Deltaproteobacteria bacterium]|nr:Spy/CpxP family protein refolding chaperone [Deltaproteobacteria bacterium]